MPIIEGILTDLGYVEEAVNIPNHGLIAELPDWIAVEVPATVDKNGVHGISVGKLPHGYAGSANNQVAVHDLTAEAILNKSKALALQALLVDPMVNNYNGIPGNAGYDDRIPGKAAGVTSSSSVTAIKKLAALYGLPVFCCRRLHAFKQLADAVADGDAMVRISAATMIRV